MFQEDLGPSNKDFGSLAKQKNAKRLTDTYYRKIDGEIFTKLSRRICTVRSMLTKREGDSNKCSK